MATSCCVGEGAGMVLVTRCVAPGACTLSVTAQIPSSQPKSQEAEAWTPPGAWYHVEARLPSDKQLH